MATARLHLRPWHRLPSLRGLVTLLAVGLVLLCLLSTSLAAGGDLGPRRLIAYPLNGLIAWADLNLKLYPRQGAERAVRLDPDLRTSLGRQGARWFATHGTVGQRLRWAAALAKRDRGELPLLRAAVAAGLCAPDRRLRRAAVRTAARARLPLAKARRPC
jgi:hypothetical protein